MSAARYVGRVGGLAVALGIGAAFFTGQQVAWAAPASSGSSAEASGPSSSSGSAANDSTKTARSASSSTATSRAASGVSPVQRNGQHRCRRQHVTAPGHHRYHRQRVDQLRHRDSVVTDKHRYFTACKRRIVGREPFEYVGQRREPQRRFHPGDTETRHSEWRSKGTSSSQSSG